jgi:membrane associated rhomboid family serine protease
MVPASVGHQCPECVGEGQRTQRQARTHFGGSLAGAQGYVTKALVGANILVFLLTVAVGGLSAVQGQETVLHYLGAVVGPSFPVGASNYPGIDDGAYYRLFTAMFLHYGIIHLLLNMWALWVLGRSLEAALGPVRYLALYLLCGIGGNVACYLFSPYAFSAGASTAIYGLFAAYFLILRKLGRNAAAILPIIVINLVLTFTIPGISIAGHLGGLVTGAVCGLGLAYAPPRYRTQVQAAVLGGTFLILAFVSVAISLAR